MHARSCRVIQKTARPSRPIRRSRSTGQHDIDRFGFALLHSFSIRLVIPRPNMSIFVVVVVVFSRPKLFLTKIDLLQSIMDGQMAHRECSLALLYSLLHYGWRDEIVNNDTRLKLCSDLLTVSFCRLYLKLIDY